MSELGKPPRAIDKPEAAGLKHKYQKGSGAAPCSAELKQARDEAHNWRFSSWMQQRAAWESYDHFLSQNLFSWEQNGRSDAARSD